MTLRDIPTAAKQLRANLRTKYSSYFDQHAVYFAIQNRIEELVAKDVASFISGYTVAELVALADQWGSDGKSEAIDEGNDA